MLDAIQQGGWGAFSMGIAMGLPMSDLAAGALDFLWNGRLARDEIPRSQQGNNNAYAQGNEISWINWQAVDEAAWDLFEFTTALIDIRQKQPLFYRGRFTGAYNEELGART